MASATSENIQSLRELFDLLFARQRELEDWLSPITGRLRAHYVGGLPERPILNALAPEPEEPIPPFTPQIEQHAGFRWLSRKAEFRDALAVYQSAIKSDRPIEVALAMLGFHANVALSTVIALKPSEWKPSAATTARRRTAERLARELLAAIRAGAEVADPGDNFQLRQLLEKYASEVTRPKKRSYKGPTAKQSLVLMGLAQQIRLKVSRPTTEQILAKLCPMLGFDPSSRTIQRYVAEAESKIEDSRRSFKK